MPPTLLTGRELADVLGESYADVLEWHREGLIPSVPADGRIYFNVKAVVKALRRAAAEARNREAAPCA